jgi:hypothetical protein
VNIVIIHFQPLELYPPIQNLLSVLNEQKHSKKIITITTSQSAISNFGFGLSESNQIIRVDVHSKSRIIRLIKYIQFYFFTFFKLLQLKPLKVIYFESISALPAILYKKMFQKTELFVHYHEYTTLNEYSNGMQIVKWNQNFEKKSFNKYHWISHTNKKRIELFHKDYPNIQSEILHCLPNYPLASWSNKRFPFNDTKDESSERLKLVYIGALSINDTYAKEIIDFVSVNNNRYELEIFSFQIEDQLNAYLMSKNCSNIKFSGFIEYMNIPDVLKSKDIGLILYKGKTLNYVHNAPNKLFEYLTCGLDVWFPEEMVGCFEYASDNLPKVLKVDFSNIVESIKSYSYSSVNRPNSNIRFSAEQAAELLIENLEL